jgi:hypothetical protein
MQVQGALHIEILVGFMIVALIARGLFPIFFDPGKIYSSFSEKCRQDRRSNNSGFDQSSEHDRRKSQSMFPQYLTSEEMQNQYRLHKIGYCFCNAFCITLLVEIFQKLIQK